VTTINRKSPQIHDKLNAQLEVTYFRLKRQQTKVTFCTQMIKSWPNVSPTTYK